MIAHMDLPTLSARVRGLAGHLLGRSSLEGLAVADFASFARALARTHVVPAGLPQPASVTDVQAGIRRAAAEHLRRLERWIGHDGALDLFYAEQDRRNLRSLLRGAVEGASALARLAAAMPTRTLPERALHELARQPTPAKVVAQLVALGHPDARRLLPIGTRANPMLFEMDLALLHGFAERMRAACRTGDRDLVAWGRARIDLANAETALALAGGTTELAPAACFVDGGETVTNGAFIEAARAASRTGASTRLARAVRGSWLAEALRASQGDPVRLEREALAATLADRRRQSRVDPLGSAPVILFLLRLEAQTRDLLRLAWGASLNAPPSRLTEALVTPWS